MVLPWCEVVNGVVPGYVRHQGWAVVRELVKPRVLQKAKTGEPRAWRQVRQRSESIAPPFKLVGAGVVFYYLHVVCVMLMIAHSM